MGLGDAAEEQTGFMCGVLDRLAVGRASENCAFACEDTGVDGAVRRLQVVNSAL